MKCIYLDSKDLIHLISRNNPMSPADFANFLTENKWQVVYSFNNVLEVANVENPLESRTRLQILDRLPHTFILALPRLQCREFISAFEAFTSNNQPTVINPYVRRWVEVGYHPEQKTNLDMLVNYDLVHPVMDLLRLNPDVCRNKPRHQYALQNAVDLDRTVSNDKRRSYEYFVGNVAHCLIECKIIPDKKQLHEFAKWLFDNPSICPGWRVYTGAMLEFTSNIEDKVELGDLPDYSHISCIPYVDAITLDKRMANYSRIAANKLKQKNPVIQYESSIFRNVSEWMKTVV